jgi:hypothetical protein
MQRVLPLRADEVPESVRRIVLRRLAEARLTAEGCREWGGGRNKHGYGRQGLKLRGRKVVVPAHRVVYALLVGPLAEGQVVAHRCDWPPCVEPTHLFATTQPGNLDDMVDKGRSTAGRPVGAAARNAAKTHCKRGHSNWHRRPNGSRYCLDCHAARVR